MNFVIYDYNFREGIFSKYLSLGMKEIELIEEFLNRFRSRNTRDGYLKELKKFFNYRLRMGLSINEISITKGEVVVYVDFLINEEKLAPKTILRNISALCSYWEYLIEIGIVNVNIFKGIAKKIESTPVIPTKIMSTEQVKEILKLSKNNILHHVIFVILFYTGMRVSELISLTRESYKDEEEFGDLFKVLNYKSKGDKLTKKVLNPKAVESIEIYLSYMKSIGREIVGSAPLLQPFRNFYSCDGEKVLQRPVSKGFINKVFKKYFKMIGIQSLKGYSAHSARTTLVTQLIENGKDIYLVSKEIGHADVATTQRCYDRSKKKLSESLLLEKIY